MNPSKENALQALAKLRKLPIEDSKVEEQSDKVAEDFNFVLEFIESAQRKLPSEETLLRDKLRKRLPPKETKL